MSERPDFPEGKGVLEVLQWHMEEDTVTVFARIESAVYQLEYELSDIEESDKFSIFDAYE